MIRLAIRRLVPLLVLIPAALLSSAAPASATTVLAAKGGHKPLVTCKQLTKAQIQPLIAGPITKVQVTSEAGAGQQCVYSDSDGDAIDVLVLKGSLATKGYKQEVAGTTTKVSVPGVGAKAFRAKGDYQIDSLKGNVFCSVSVGGSATVPGVGTLEEANGGTSTIPESDNATIAVALGTICNRIYKSGNTTPSLGSLSKDSGTTSTTTGNSGTRSGSGTEIDACSLLSATQAGALTGVGYATGMSSTIATGQDECTYPSNTGSGLTIIVYQPSSGVTWQTMQQVLALSGTVTSVSGVGDQAMVGAIELDVQAGTHLIAIQGAGGTGDDTAAVAIAKTLISALT